MKSYEELEAELPIQPMDKVKIKKGAFIRTTYPKPNYECSRPYIVTVHSVSPSYKDGEKMINPKICWVGSGGYWFYTDMENVERVMTGIDFDRVRREGEK